MKILILGGTGAMGVSLVDVLDKQGHDVYVTSRRKHADCKNVHYLQGDAHDLTWLEQITSGKRYDALVDFMIYSTDDFAWRRDKLLNMAGQYVFLSSSRVYNDSSDKPITEETPRLLDSTQDKEYLSMDEYALAKAREENELRKAKQKNWTIIRPYITYNDERLQLGTLEKESWLYRALHGRTIVFTRDVADCLTTLTHGRDVAEGIASLLGKEAAYGEAFHIVGPEPMRWGEVAELYCDVLETLLGRRPKIMLLPNSRKFCQVFCNEYQVKYDRLFHRVFDSSKILRIGGKRDYVPIAEGLRSCLTHFVEQHRPFRTIDWHAEAWMDRQTGERAALSECKGWKNKVKYILCRYTPFLHYYYGI
ncbi:NAD-dependent epimerase/dehydratase family protein [Mitsuokella jalaludinii]|uniref:Putative NADH-flavin reductase n=1 Tax=Mitsuokella jalaludinii TaxID=187979 RepID=A0A173XJ31_9FIRM|nr:NAD-dependent epimerase/dehydratase family protein [Mitsuokella jalaludinii]CUN51861.1 Putative NADH-flavin reductase [Mitsuokella jalaludinii]